MQVDVSETKTDFSKLINVPESGQEDEHTVSKRIGAFKGKFEISDDFDTDNGEIAEMLK